MIRIKYFRSSVGFYTDWFAVNKDIVMLNIISDVLYMITQEHGIIGMIKCNHPRHAKEIGKKWLMNLGLNFMEEVRTKERK